MKNYLLSFSLVCILLFACTKNEQLCEDKQTTVSKGMVSISDTIMQDLLEKIHFSKAQNNKKDLTWLYSRVASHYIMEQEVAKGKLYLDSAQLYFRNIEKDKDKAFFYHIYGDYYNSKMNDSLSHKYYYKAKELYGEKDLNIVPVLFNLSISYFHRNDTLSLKKIVDKMLRIAKSQNNKVNLAFAYKANYNYYNCLYQLQIPRNEALLDQALHYANKTIKLLEQDTSIQISELTAYDFYTIADIILQKENTNLDSVKYFLKKTKEYSLPNDTVMLYNLLDIKARYEYKINELDSCIATSQEQLTLLNTWSAETTSLSAFYDIYSLLEEVAIKQGDYKSALLYEKQQNEYRGKLQNKEKYKIIEELREKYETEKKNKEIKTKQRINYLLSTICIILVVLTYFIVKWYKTKKVNTEITLKMIEEDYTRLEQKYEMRKLESENAEHKWRQSELDKLSQDITLKEAQAELGRLRNLERNLEQEDRCWHLKEMEKMILEKSLTLVHPSEEYIKRIDLLKNNFIERLKEKELTNGQIFYCIAFIIRMEPADIASCIGIEIGSVKQRKYTIKSFLATENLSLEEYLDNLTLTKPNQEWL